MREQIDPVWPDHLHNPVSDIAEALLHPAPDPSTDSKVQEQNFVFSGTGKEYFRIWIVNLCLTIATAGIYSAWAKVRRLQYFHRNTALAGAVFDFHGDPKAILKGRLVAVVVLTAYHYAFGFSRNVGIAVILCLILGLPWMLRSALRFRLRNTSYRGLRFGFDGSLASAYLAWLPAVLIWFVPSILLALFPTEPTWFLYSFALYLMWPIAHAQIKRYQHSNYRYGASGASCVVSTRRIAAIYFWTFLIGIGATGVAMVLAALFSFGVHLSGVHFKNALFSWLPLIIGIFMVYGVYLLAVPYLFVRIHNMVWSRTTLPGIAIDSHLRALGYIRLQTGNALLTLLTCGLYRPFAVVRAYRYRLSMTTLSSATPFDQLLADAHKPVAHTTGEGAADFLGIDLSW